jgi:hypothetical protein
LYRLWGVQARRTEVTNRLKPLAPDKAAQACLLWIERTSKEAEPALAQLLHGCGEPAQLAAMEASLRKAMDAWQHSPDVPEPHSG